MPTYWDDFLFNFQGVSELPLQKILQLFWEYLQDGKYDVQKSFDGFKKRASENKEPKIQSATPNNTERDEIFVDMMATVQGCSDMMDKQIKDRIISWARKLSPVS